MKKCFTFENCKDSKVVAKFLQTTLSCTVHVQLNNAITVPKDMYQKAILEGKKFVKENNIPCNWVDFCGNELPLTLAPFAIITLNKDHVKSPYCITASAISSIKFFSNFCESFLKRKLFTQVRFDGTIAFLLENSQSTNEHLAIAKSVQEHCYYLSDNIYIDMVFTDYFGIILPNT